MKEWHVERKISEDRFREQLEYEKSQELEAKRCRQREYEVEQREAWLKLDENEMKWRRYEKYLREHGNSTTFADGTYFKAR